MWLSKPNILAELPWRLLNNRRGWAIGGFACISILGIAAATAVVDPYPSILPSDTRIVVEKLAVSPLSLPESDLPFVHDTRVAPGDTIPAIFRRLGVNDPDALSFIQTNEEARQSLRQLRAGRSLTAVMDRSGKLLSISLPLAQAGNQLVIERSALDEPFQLHTTDKVALETVVEMRSGIIQHSLFAATDAVDLPDSIAIQLADLFGTEVDFHTDLRRGDSFSVIYETYYDRGITPRSGRILAAEFINQGKRYAVVLHTTLDGKSQHYSSTGRSLRQSFLRSPLEFSRVTSNFGRRLHPIFKNWREHKGVDFGAPTGTPVRATSDGVVSFVGTQNGYGKIVVIKHRGNISTAYAHLSAFAPDLKVGDKVGQGQTVARVGSTGYATAPHLHYEVRLGAVPHDPMTVALPKADPLTGDELARFAGNAQPLLARLAMLNHRNNLAVLEQGTEDKKQ
ncbi:MAG: M23 family metallopeptidase [Azoarcus sp.]|jgi:murein DD-endopeptidase MepM/ murein hydrolase activator NlpD|nr:M23 family metallopeptidase [Azoarcus sp.]